jgi:dienelactone hydrolase
VADVVLFHSAYGLRPAVRALAQAWRDEGHRVETPDLYEGKVASDLQAALALRDAVGRDELLRRARMAVGDARPGTVLCGLSLGAALAQRVAASDPRFSRLLLLHGVAEVPPRLPAPWIVEAHVAEHDSWAPADEVETWRRSLTDLGARVEVGVHTGGHLFTDPDLPDHDPVSAARVRARALLFLAG